VVPLVSLIYLFTIDWRLTLITLIPVVLAVALVPLMMTPARLREQKEFDGAMGRIASSAVEFVHGISVVKAFGGGERSHRKFLKAADDFVVIFFRWVRGVSAIAAGMQLALSLVGAEYCVTSRDLGVFVEEAAEPVSSDDLDVGVDGIGQCPQRAGLVQGPVRTMRIEVGLVLGEDFA
jgi:ABC-type multidrug transport system fused ATPase/permease subunit